MSDTKYCTDCAHHRFDRHKSICNRPGIERDIINGKPMGESSTCNSQRYGILVTSLGAVKMEDLKLDYCGKAGKFFEPKSASTTASDVMDQSESRTTDDKPHLISRTEFLALSLGLSLGVVFGFLVGYAQSHGAFF
jgi:hypothetical protein